MEEQLQENERNEFIPPSSGAQLFNKPASYYERRNLLSNKDLIEKALEFCIIFSGKNWYSYQKAMAKRIVESVILNEGETITGLFSRQSGKSETIANTAIGLAILLPALAKQVYPDDERLTTYKNGFWVGIFAPIQEQADVSHNRIRTLIETDHAKTMLSECGQTILTNRGGNIALDTNSYIHSRSASPDSKIEGKTYHLIIVEEAQLVSRYKVNKEIGPMLSSTNGTMIKIGTAHMSKGGFHNSIQYNIAVYKNGGKRNHFEFPYDLVIKEKTNTYKKDGNMFHLQYERWVQKEIARIGGTQNEEFQMNFELKWKESKKVALSESQFGKLGNKLLEANAFTSFGYQVAGMDVAKEGDETVITIMRVEKETPILDTNQTYTKENGTPFFYKKVILGWLALRGSFEGNDGQYQQIVEYLRMWNVSVMVVDATGMGDPVAERLSVLLPQITIVPFKYSLASKSSLYKYYLPELNSGRIEYPAGIMTRDSTEFKNFQKQHINLDREFNGAYLVVEGADGEHDDYPNSAALACWASKSDLDIPEVEVDKPKPVGKSEIASWKKLGATSHRSDRYRKRY